MVKVDTTLDGGLNGQEEFKMAGKGSKQRPKMITQKQFEDNWDKIFVRKKTPDHGKTQVHSDKTKYNRKNQKVKQASMTDLNWDGNY